MHVHMWRKLTMWKAKSSILSSKYCKSPKKLQKNLQYCKYWSIYLFFTCMQKIKSFPGLCPRRVFYHLCLGIWGYVKVLWYLSPIFQEERLSKLLLQVTGTHSLQNLGKELVFLLFYCVRRKWPPKTVLFEISTRVFSFFFPKIMRKFKLQTI